MADTRFLVITVLCYSIVTVVILTVCCCAFWRYKKDSSRPHKARKGRLSVRRTEKTQQTTLQIPSTLSKVGAGGGENHEIPQQAPLQEANYVIPYLESSLNKGTYLTANPQPITYLPGKYLPPNHGGVFGTATPAGVQIPFTMTGGLPPSLPCRQSVQSENDGGSDTYRDTSQYTGDELSDMLSSRGDVVSDEKEII